MKSRICEVQTLLRILNNGQLTSASFESTAVLTLRAVTTLTAAFCGISLNFLP